MLVVLVFFCGIGDVLGFLGLFLVVFVCLGF